MEYNAAINSHVFKKYSLGKILIMINNKNADIQSQIQNYTN